MIYFLSSRYISLPAFSLDAILETTKVELELLSEEKSDIYFSIEYSIRGGITSVVKRKAEVTNNNDNSLLYLDANNKSCHMGIFSF